MNSKLGFLTVWNRYYRLMPVFSSNPAKHHPSKPWRKSCLCHPSSFPDFNPSLSINITLPGLWKGIHFKMCLTPVQQTCTKEAADDLPWAAGHLNYMAEKGFPNYNRKRAASTSVPTDLGLQDFVRRDDICLDRSKSTTGATEISYPKYSYWVLPA